MHRAVAWGCEAVVSLLLEKGADVSAKRSGGGTPLYLATECSNDGAVRLLLEYGAALSAVAEYKGVAPLHIAAGKGDEAVVEP